MANVLKRLLLNGLPEPLSRPFRKWHYARTIPSVSEIEEPDFAVLQQLVKPGEPVVDVGANYGLYTHFLARLVGPSGQVFAFEPVAATFDVLEHNIKKWRLENVRLFDIALSDMQTRFVMEIPIHETGVESFYDARIVTGEPEAGLRHVEIEAETMDSVFAENPAQPSFIKIDVEGHEYRTLVGARQTITRYRPSLLIEIAADPDDPASDGGKIRKELGDLGYGIYVYADTILRRKPQAKPSINYFFLNSGHIERLRGGNLEIIDE